MLRGVRARLYGHFPSEEVCIETRRFDIFFRYGNKIFGLRSGAGFLVKINRASVFGCRFMLFSSYAVSLCLYTQILFSVRKQVH